MHVCRCACVQVCRCAGVQVCRRADVQVCRSAGVHVYRCAGVHVYRCAGVQVCRCTGVSTRLGGMIVNILGAELVSINIIILIFLILYLNILNWWETIKGRCWVPTLDQKMLGPMFKSFSLNRPSWPIQSISCDVRLSVCLCVCPSVPSR